MLCSGWREPGCQAPLTAPQRAQVFTWHGVVLELTADAEGLEEVTDVVYAPLVSALLRCAM